ncbi:MAG: hypothetical protein ACOCXT_06835 [Candidatus Dojkabacteria bacterium]
MNYSTSYRATLVYFSLIPEALRGELDEELRRELGGLRCAK